MSGTGRCEQPDRNETEGHVNAGREIYSQEQCCIRHKTCTPTLDRTRTRIIHQKKGSSTLSRWRRQTNNARGHRAPEKKRAEKRKKKKGSSTPAGRAPHRRPVPMPAQPPGHPPPPSPHPPTHHQDTPLLTVAADEKGETAADPTRAPTQQKKKKDAGWAVCSRVPYAVCARRGGAPGQEKKKREKKGRGNHHRAGHCRCCAAAAADGGRLSLRRGRARPRPTGW